MKQVDYQCTHLDERMYTATHDAKPSDIKWRWLSSITGMYDKTTQ